MVSAERFESDAQFNCRIAVDGDKLVVFQFDDISVGLGDNTGDAVEFTGLVRQKDGNGKDPVSKDKALLDHGRHGDDIHVSSAENTGHLLISAVQMAEGSDRQKP